MRRRFQIEHLASPSLREPFGYDRSTKIGVEGAIALRHGFVVAFASKYPRPLHAHTDCSWSFDGVASSSHWGGSVQDLLAASEFADCDVLGGRQVGGWFAADRVLRAASPTANKHSTGSATGPEKLDTGARIESIRHSTVARG